MLQAKKKWVDKTPPSSAAIDGLAQALPTVKHRGFLSLLAARGIENYEQARAFMALELNQLHDPFLMKDMDLAVERLEQALELGEKIMVYGDYDVDGTTSVALVYHYLRYELGAEVMYYIPDRFSEGYGISQAGIVHALEQGVGLIIALDCGIKANDKVDWCQEHGIDLVICDHHLPGAELPAAKAVLDPKRPDCPYPFKELTGCGIGFKLLQAFIQKNELDLESIWPSLDLLACSIAADIVPMVGENRVLAHFGLCQLAQNPRPGLAYLLQKAGKQAPYQISDLVFYVAPAINAAGRMEHAHGALKLLLAEDQEQAAALAQQVIDQNAERKALEKTMVAEALALFDEDPFLAQAQSTVVFQPHWNKGVVGIAASKIQEHYYRPTIVLTESNGHAVGSARSVKGFDIHAALEQSAHLLLQFGGHTHAAGLHLDMAQLPAFRAHFDALVQAELKGREQKAELIIDLVLGLDQLSLGFYEKLLLRLAPFGPGNMHPVFRTGPVYLQQAPFLMKEQHLKLKISSQKQGPSLEAVGFFLSSAYEDLQEAFVEKIPIELAYHLDINEFRGQRNLQIRILDMRMAEDFA